MKNVALTPPPPSQFGAPEVFFPEAPACEWQERVQEFEKKGGAPKFEGDVPPQKWRKTLISRFGVFFLSKAPTQSEAPYL